MAEAHLDENGHVGQEKRIKHYSNLHRILLVGEGDFSFAACLARTFGAAINLVATSLDSRGMIEMSYATLAINNLEAIEGFGGTVLHEVDAHTMSEHPILKQKSFDRIVYNFPHAGFHGPEASLLQIELHRDLVRGFLKNAKTMLTEAGEIHVTHKTTYPYSKWEIKKLAEEQGLFLVEEAPFSAWDYRGYLNRKGSGTKCHHTFRIGEASTYKFSKNDQKNLETSPKECQAEKSVIKGKEASKPKFPLSHAKIGEASGAKCHQTFPGEASTYEFSKNDHKIHCANALLNLSLADLIEPVRIYFIWALLIIIVIDYWSNK